MNDTPTRNTKPFSDETIAKLRDLYAKAERDATVLFRERETRRAR